MQTFLPYPSFIESARVLDNKRLGKQRVECYQILRAITDSSYGWQNHPAVNMWRTHPCILVAYGFAICGEWQSRGYKDSIENKLNNIWDRELYTCQCRDSGKPNWLGLEYIHSSHRAALLAKDYNHYSQFGWTEEPKIDYWWPSKHGY